MEGQSPHLGWDPGHRLAGWAGAQRREVSSGPWEARAGGLWVCFFGEDNLGIGKPGFSTRF